MNPMQNGQQNQYQMHPMTQQRMMGMNNMQQMNQYQMGMNNMNNMGNMSQMQQMNNMQMNQMMMRQQQSHQSQQQRYNNFRSNQMQNNMQQNMRSNMQMNMQNTNRSTHTQSNSQNTSSNNQSSNNNSNNANKGPTKDTWISPFKNRDQNIDFFMYAYKCQPCPLRRNCQSKVTCPGWHHEGEKRRNPGEDPNFLYSEEPCPNVKPQGSNKWQPPSRCTDGDECGYSHTLLEQMYHPNIYKTSMCINFTNPQGNKCQWGFYCTHAHGQEDIRNPNKKQSESNDAGDSSANTPTNKDKTSATTSSKTAAPTSNTPTKPSVLPQKDNKRPRSQSDAPQLYNGGHIRSPVYDQPMMTQQQHGPRSHMLPQYNQYASYNGQHTSASSNATPPRGHGAATDYPSPLPYQAAHAKAYAQNPPPLRLHNETNAMYSQHDHYAQQYHMAAYHHAQKRPRSRSEGGLVQYMPKPASQQPNIPSVHDYRYPTHDPHMQYSSHTGHHTTQPTEDMPGMHPVMEASRTSRTYNPSKIKDPSSAAVVTPATPPPPTGEQAKSSSRHFLNGDINFYDPRARSQTVGGVHDGQQNPYLPNPAAISHKLTKMNKLRATSSLPSYAYPNKVPPLPGQDNSTAASKGYYFKETLPNPTRKRHRSESEPLLPPLPNGQYNMASDSIWRTGPNQEPQGSSSNPNKSDTQSAPRVQKPLSSDPFSSQKRLKSIPDVPDQMMSPNALNIEHIITPRGMISPGGQPKEADWNYFGFNREDVQGVTSPIPDPKDVMMKKKIDVPPTPTPPPDTIAVDSKKVKKRIGTKISTISRPKTMEKEVSTKDEQIKRLKKDLEVATHQMQILSAKKDVSIPTMESAAKKSEILKIKNPNDDEKETEKNTEKQELTEIQRQQLLRYKHFITCPSCKQFDPTTPRNHVLIPCGHLVCGKCSAQTQDNQTCPICNERIENYQLLLIG
eukprot:61160_1